MPSCRPASRRRCAAGPVRGGDPAARGRIVDDGLGRHDASTCIATTRARCSRVRWSALTRCCAPGRRRATSAGWRASTAPCIRRAAATCTGSARISRHGSRTAAAPAAWLADLARLEWACEEVLVAARCRDTREALGADALRRLWRTSVSRCSRRCAASAPPFRCGPSGTRTNPISRRAGCRGPRRRARRGHPWRGRLVLPRCPEPRTFRRGVAAGARSGSAVENSRPRVANLPGSSAGSSMSGLVIALRSP